MSGNGEGVGIVCFTDFGMYVLSCVFVNFGVTVHMDMCWNVYLSNFGHVCMC